MQIDLIPSPGDDLAVARAAVAALTQQRLADVEPRSAATSAWARSARRTLGDPNDALDGWASDPAEPPLPGRGYVPPAPRSRGATRA